MTEDEILMRKAVEVAALSEDETKIGAVISSSDGSYMTSAFNGFPRLVRRRPERATRPEKYGWTIHAEAAAICNAAMVGYKLNLATMHLT